MTGVDCWITSTRRSWASKGEFQPQRIDASLGLQEPVPITREQKTDTFGSAWMWNLFASMSALTTGLCDLQSATCLGRLMLRITRLAPKYRRLETCLPRRISA